MSNGSKHRGDAPRGGLEASSLEAFATEHAGALYRFALALSRDPDVAEDLVQETFTRALERRDQFRGDASVGTWVRRILHNLAIDRARHLARETLADDVEAKWMDDAYTVDSETVLERAETRDELEDALVRLPFIYRSAVVLHDIEELTVAEIAAAQDIGVPAAKQRLRRGRMMLVSELGRGSERRAALGGVPLSCWSARRKVSDYLDGELEQKDQELVEAHLRSCPTCPPLYASLVGVRAGLGRLRDPDTVVPPRLAERITAEARRGRQ